jgi:predicted Zn-ribbon and HTH transcriptional regulator
MSTTDGPKVAPGPRLPSPADKTELVYSPVCRNCGGEFTKANPIGEWEWCRQCAQLDETRR